VQPEASLASAYTAFAMNSVERSVVFKPSTGLLAGGQVTGSHLAFVGGKRS
jgi:hypothetical protein